MNERYLFRGKRKDNNEWVEGYLYITHNGEYEISRYDDELDTERITYIVIPETVGQCAGKTDCNGKFIFECDLLRFTDSDGEQSIYKVFYNGNYAGWAIQEVGCGGIDSMADWETNREYFELIGSMYDTPELLEVER